MMSRSWAKKKKPPGLMLTSLLDMFTIILIFLIVSFDAEDQEFKLNESLTLPESKARSSFKPAVNIAVTNDALLVDDVPVLKLSAGRFSEDSYAKGQIPELVEVLEAKYERVKLKAEYEGTSLDEAAVIIIQADRQLDYRTLYTVLRTAAVAGFYKYRLAIMKQ